MVKQLLVTLALLLVLLPAGNCGLQTFVDQDPYEDEYDPGHDETRPADDPAIEDPQQGVATGFQAVQATQGESPEGGDSAKPSAPRDGGGQLTSALGGEEYDEEEDPFEKELVDLENQLFMREDLRDVSAALTGLLKVADRVPRDTHFNSVFVDLDQLFKRKTGWKMKGAGGRRHTDYPADLLNTFSSALTSPKLWYPNKKGAKHADKPPDAPRDFQGNRPPPPPKEERPTGTRLIPHMEGDPTKFIRHQNMMQRRPIWMEDARVRVWAGVGDVYTPKEGFLLTPEMEREGGYGSLVPGKHQGAHALFLLSVHLSSGLLDPALLRHLPNELLTAEWQVEALKQAARAGSLAAIMAIGERFITGRDFPRDCAAGVWHLWAAADEVARAAEQEDDVQLPAAALRLRERHRDGSWRDQTALTLGTDPEQMDMEEALADHGAADAQRQRGFRRLMGQGVDRDAAAAYEDFEAAAAGGDEYAEFNLGYMHLYGVDVPLNYTKARKHFQKAADMGLPAAWNGLGTMEFNGLGRQHNFTAAREFFEKAANLNDPDALFNLAQIHQHGLGTVRDDVKAKGLFESAVELGHWKAPYVLAQIHAEGRGVAANCTHAAQLFRLFLDERAHWDEDINWAATVLDEGDHFGSLTRFVMLAEQGSEVAISNVAWMLTQGIGYEGALRPNLAVEWLSRSAAFGSFEAYVDLGNLYYHGLATTAQPPLSPEDAAQVERLRSQQDLEVLKLPVGAGAGEGAEEGVGAWVRRALRMRPSLDLPAKHKNDQYAAALYQKAHSAGILEGTFNLAFMYEKGYGVERDWKKAEELYLEAWEEAKGDSAKFPAFVALWVLRGRIHASRLLRGRDPRDATASNPGLRRPYRRSLVPEWWDSDMSLLLLLFLALWTLVLYRCMKELLKYYNEYERGFVAEGAEQRAEQQAVRGGDERGRERFRAREQGGDGGASEEEAGDGEALAAETAE